MNSHCRPSSHNVGWSPSSAEPPYRKRHHALLTHIVCSGKVADVAGQVQYSLESRPSWEVQLARRRLVFQYRTWTQVQRALQSLGGEVSRKADANVRGDWRRVSTCSECHYHNCREMVVCSCVANVDFVIPDTLLPASNEPTSFLSRSMMIKMVHAWTAQAHSHVVRNRNMKSCVEGGVFIYVM